MAEQSVTLAPGESKVVAFEATPTVAKIYQVSVDGLTGSFTALATPPTKATLYGVVIDAVTSYTLQGVKVTLDSLVTYTDSSGYYSITNLSPGAHTLKFEKSGYETLVR